MIMTDSRISAPIADIDDDVLSGGLCESPTTSERLKRTRCLVDSVIPIAATVNVFASRWGPIRRRLEQFPPQIAHLQRRFASLNVNSIPCDELMQKVAANVEETRDLAEKCVEEAFGGKLQMQSRLDAVWLKLERNLQECQVLAKTTDATTKEMEKRGKSVRWGLVRDLLMRIQVGSRESKQKAMERLVVVMKEEEKNVVMVAKEGGMRVMVEMMEWGKGYWGVGVDDDDEEQEQQKAMMMREKAMEAMERMTEIEGCEKMLVTEGVAGALVRVLRSSTNVSNGGWTSSTVRAANLKEKAAKAMSNLTKERACAKEVIEGAGGVIIIGALLEVCRTGVPAAQSAAAGAIRNLVRAAAAAEEEEDSSSPNVPKKKYCKKNALLDDEEAAAALLPVLLSLIISGTPLSQEFACETLHSLLFSSGSIPQPSDDVLDGFIHPLLLFHDQAPSPSAKQAAMSALTSLAASSSLSPSSLQSLLAAAFLPRLVSSLLHGLVREQEFAASAVFHLAKRSSELRKLLGSAGCIPPLVRMLEAKTSTARELASRAISSLISVDCNRKAFCREDRSIEKLVALLDPTNVNYVVDDKAAAAPIAALMCLAAKKKHRIEMAAAGACLYLARLAEQEEEAETGANKLMGKLRGCCRKSNSTSSNSSSLSWSGLFRS